MDSIMGGIGFLLVFGFSGNGDVLMTTQFQTALCTFIVCSGLLTAIMVFAGVAIGFIE